MFTFQSILLSQKKSTLLIISKSDFHWKLWGVCVKQACLLRGQYFLFLEML